MSASFSVLHVSASGMLGGAERVLLDLIAWQRRRRSTWKPSLLTLGSGPLLDAARSLGVPATSLPLPARLERLGESGQTPVAMLTELSTVVGPAWRFVRALRDQVHTGSPQLIHSHSLKTHVLLALAGIRDARLLWHMHDYVSTRPTSMRLLRALGGRCDMAIGNSRSVTSDINTSLPRIRVTTVLNGVDVAGLSAPGPDVCLDALSGLPKAPAGTLRVGLVATFARWKGHTTFLRALAELSDIPVRGYVIGGPVYQTKGSQYSQSELEALASTLRLGGRVGFPGFVDDRAACLRALDVVVHASTEPEPFGLVVAEAMAVGRPLIMSATGGAAELVRPGIDALTHRPGDPTSLAAAIRQLVASPALRSRLGAAAQAAARERFSMDRFGIEMEEAYCQAGVGVEAA